MAQMRYRSSQQGAGEETGRRLPPACSAEEEVARARPVWAAWAVPPPAEAARHQDGASGPRPGRHHRGRRHRRGRYRMFGPGDSDQPSQNIQLFAPRPKDAAPDPNAAAAPKDGPPLPRQLRQGQFRALSSDTPAATEAAPKDETGQRRRQRAARGRVRRRPTRLRRPATAPPRACSRIRRSWAP